LGTKTHFPYLPGMLLFGLPRAVAGTAAATDGRVWFALATFGALGLGFRRWRAPPERKLLAFQLLLVVPTGALALATGGDDVPVAALIFLALVLLTDDRPGGAALAAGAAAALKQTAWLALPFLVIAIGRQRGRRGALAAAGLSLGVVVAVVGPFVAWN